MNKQNITHKRKKHAKQPSKPSKQNCINQTSLSCDLFTFREDWLSVSELLQDLGSTSKTITRFTNAAVDNQLINLKLTHGILELIFSHFILYNTPIEQLNNYL
jgi:hypothetical protein